MQGLAAILGNLASIFGHETHNTKPSLSVISGQIGPTALVFLDSVLLFDAMYH